MARLYRGRGGRKISPTQSSGLPAGFVFDFAGIEANTPEGFLPCDGRSILVADYPDLFDAIGYTYGGASANFNIPDYRGRVGVGKDNMGGVAASRVSAGNNGTTLGGVHGQESHALTTAELAAHGHSLNDPGHLHHIGSGNDNAFNPGYAAAAGNHGVGDCFSSVETTGVTINNTGSGTAHNTLQPGLIVNKIISY